MRSERRLPGLRLQRVAAGALPTDRDEGLLVPRFGGDERASALAGAVAVDRAQPVRRSWRPVRRHRELRLADVRPDRPGVRRPAGGGMGRALPGPSDYGLLAYVLASVAMFHALATLGADAIVVRDISQRPQGAADILGSAFVLRASIGGLCWAVPSCGRRGRATAIGRPSCSPPSWRACSCSRPPTSSTWVPEPEPEPAHGRREARQLPGVERHQDRTHPAAGARHDVRLRGSVGRPDGRPGAARRLPPVPDGAPVESPEGHGANAAAGGVAVHAQRARNRHVLARRPAGDQ